MDIIGNYNFTERHCRSISMPVRVNKIRQHLRLNAWRNFNATTFWSHEPWSGLHLPEVRDTDKYQFDRSFWMLTQICRRIFIFSTRRNIYDIHIIPTASSSKFDFIFLRKNAAWISLIVLCVASFVQYHASLSKYNPHSAPWSTNAHKRAFQRHTSHAIERNVHCTTNSQFCLVNFRASSRGAKVPTCARHSQLEH